MSQTLFSTLEIQDKDEKYFPLKNYLIGWGPQK